MNLKLVVAQRRDFFEAAVERSDWLNGGSVQVYDSNSNISSHQRRGCPDIDLFLIYLLEWLLAAGQPCHRIRRTRN